MRKNIAENQVDKNVENEDKKQCAFCKAYLFAEDDVVVCPECGAYHHRGCYNKCGGCIMAEHHGEKIAETVSELQAEEKIFSDTPVYNDDENTYTDDGICKMCGQSMDSNAPYCEHCGAPNFAKIRYTRGGEPIDLLGGVPSDMEIEKGVFADKIKRFVFSQSNKYLPKFSQMHMGRKIFWNWAAFLFPCTWFASRKMYLKSIIAGILTIAFTICAYPFTTYINSASVGTSTYFGVQQAGDILASTLQSGSKSLFLLFVVAMILNIVLRFLCGMFGDLIYKNHTCKMVLEIENQSEDKDKDYRKYGGVSLRALLISLAIMEFLPQLIYNFIA